MNHSKEPDLPPEDLQHHLRHEMDEAERKAWQSLARYKFQMFGYWAAIWVHLNRIGGFKSPNPFRPAVNLAKAHTDPAQPPTVSRTAAPSTDPHH